MNLVIVESPAKAKTINKYLGGNYTVLASYGHIRDLPSKNGSVDPEDKFKMIWEVDSFSKKYLKEITDVAKKSKKIILATDPDREGEAIAWHVKEYLDEKKLLKDKKIERVVFNEITKKAVTNGIDNPRNIEPNLVDAYMARRALDYLVGINISPILWTKLPGSKSAGRVQSVALRLLTEREHEIELFKKYRPPKDMLLFPGCIDVTYNYLEHPQVVANRILDFVEVIGERERVIASTDCGFSTFAGYVMVANDVAWAKLKTLSEGAKIASSELWSN